MNIIREVIYDIIVALRVRSMAEGQQLNLQILKVTKDYLQNILLFTLRIDYNFRALRTELEINSIRK